PTLEPVSIYQDEEIDKLTNKVVPDKQYTSKAERILRKLGYDFKMTAGQFIIKGGEVTGKISEYAASKNLGTNLVSMKQKMMWENGQYVLVTRSASNKAELWVKNLYPQLSAKEASAKTREKVLNDLGFNGVDGPNVLKRSQIVLATGTVGFVSKELGKESRIAKTSGWARKSNNGYEVSSKGNKKFSAFSARIKKRGNRTIEEIWQTDIKGYSTVKDGKGKPPRNKISFEDYKNLWREYFNENPNDLIEIAKLSDGKTLTDQFANTENNQARAISEIINESNINIGGNRKTKAMVVAERKWAWFKHDGNGGQFGIVDKKEDAPEGTDPKPIHDGAIYVTEEWMKAYNRSLGEPESAKYAKSFGWQQYGNETLALKGAFFVAKEGSIEHKMLQDRGVDMLVYEDASKLNASLDKVYEVDDESIRFKLREHPVHSAETFSRSIINMIPSEQQKNYNPFFNSLLTKLFDRFHKILYKEGEISKFYKQSTGATESPLSDHMAQFVAEDPLFHPYILGKKGQENPFKQQWRRFVQQSVLKMPRKGFYSNVKPWDESTDHRGRTLSPKGIAISKEAAEKNGFKIGSKVMFARHPIVRADSIMILTVEQIHDEGNIVKMHPSRYAVFSTGDYDGDSGAVLKAETWEEKFFDQTGIRDLVGDI
ncbi:MAG: hypothetical protein KDC84_16160, partial [Crocinitomicaceae bacterium]|nr:hypothetical protein [Crocinitomicaceae bacterium]